MQGRVHGRQPDAPATAAASSPVAASPGNQAVQRAVSGGQPAGVLGMLGAAGNAAVQRMVTVQRQDFQLRLPEIGESLGWRPPPGDDHRLRLDPQIEAYFRATQALHAHVAPPVVSAGLAQINIGVPPVPAPPPGPQPLPPGPAPAPVPAPAPQPRTDPAAQEPRPRAADFGDLWSAIQALPEVKSFLDRLQTEALAVLRRDWTSAPTGERIVMITGAVAVAGLAGAGVLSSQEGRDFARDQINGRRFPVPGVGGLHIEVTLTENNAGLGLHLDVGRFLPPQWGFGPASSPGTLGGPPVAPSGPGPF
ncbi:hypothetical protein JOF56_006616 [Kibdelosporangium banguiense]|uniref:Uncharacterized protein n=1 Tax=Kibdelosporangium banguiense TaxID=1365924 RepID=A0ABS4TQT0_9PSEU|nr:hypothetical protein [Kibdelosporangium banguiense]MBP2326231.1 hypothetical protein [Kibdelosporangium banguiense]